MRSTHRRGYVAARIDQGFVVRAAAVVAFAAVAACNHAAPAQRGEPAAPPLGKSNADGSAGPASDGAAKSTKQQAAKARAPFVVAIVVDQLSAWVATSRFPELSPDGAFARLRREGTWLRNVRYPYAVTDTAPGHTSLHTGRVPAESGIFGNEIPDGAGHNDSILHDETVHAVTRDGVREAKSSSPARLRADTVADRLRAARPDALVISVSVKDRAAILPGGKRPTHALWFEASHDSFVTSTAYATAYPKWAVGIADAEQVVRARQAPWSLPDPKWIAAHAVTPDDQAGEGDMDGLGITFPHVAKTPRTFRALPASDEMVTKLGLAAIEAEYDPSRPTLLLLSMSASDVIGHVFGPDSWEAWEHLRRLDVTLASLLDALERKVGGPVDVIVSADHGNVSMPEVASAREPAECTADPYERPCKGGARLGLTALRGELAGAAKAALGEGHFIDGFADPYVFLSPKARALAPDRRAVLDRAVRATFAKHRAAVREVYDVRLLAKECPATLARAADAKARARAIESVQTLVCRSWADGIGAGDYYVVPEPGSFFDSEFVIGKGSGHGTPYLYDRTVWMLARGAGVDSGVVVDAPVDFTVFSDVEAALLGLHEQSARDILRGRR